MSYLVLARKWRPESFADVVGQKHVVLTLAAAVETDRVAHAHLFTGPRGVGKTTVARILAKSLNCEKGPTGEPCGQCESCREIAGGRSLDVIEIDGASNRKIEDARGIRETVQYAPLSGRMKVYIIDEAHMLTREAFNALLKTLEEPPPHVVFVLATTEPGKIPETIASRCQRFDFHRISSAEIEARLAQISEAEGIEVADGALKLVASRADGSMRDAVSLLDQLISVGKGHVTPEDVSRVLGIPDSDVYFAISDGIASHDTGATLSALEKALEAGFDARDLLDGFVDHSRNLLLVRAAPEPERLVGRIAEYTGHEGASSEMSEDDLVRIVRIGIEAQATAKWSTQPGLIVELALLRMARLARSIAIEDVVRAMSAADAPRGGGETGSSGGASGGGTARKKTAPAGKQRAGSRETGERSVSVQEAQGGPATDAGRGSEAPPAEASPDRWPEVLERIRQERPSLAASLADAVPWTDGPGKLGLRVPNGTAFHMDQLRDRANMSIMESAASSVFGGSVRVRLEFAKAAPSQAGGDAAVRTGRPDTDADPIVRKVVEMFDGRITGKSREE